MGECSTGAKKMANFKKMKREQKNRNFLLEVAVIL